MLRSTQLVHQQCSGLLPTPIKCRGFGRTLPQTQPGFSGRTLINLNQSSSRVIPTSTASAAIYEPAKSQQVSDAPQKALAAAIAALPWLPGALKAIGSMCQFLGAVVERVRSSVASAFPQLQGVTAEVWVGLVASDCCCCGFCMAAACMQHGMGHGRAQTWHACRLVHGFATSDHRRDHLRSRDVHHVHAMLLGHYQPPTACARSTHPTITCGQRNRMHAPLASVQEVHVQLRSLANNVKVLAIVAPLARAASSESLTALYARTFERAAFGFAKVRLPDKRRFRSVAWVKG